MSVRDAPSADQRSIEVSLIERVRDGDDAALADLYARLGGAMYSLAYRIVRDAASAEDVVQEVFVATWQSAARYDSKRGSPASWLFTLTRHKAIDLLRRETTSRSRTVDTDTSSTPGDDDVEQQVWQSIRSDRARRAVATLSTDQREAVELAFFGGLTHVEVAERLEIPLGTAKTRIRLGLLRLRDQLKDAVQDTDA